MNRQAGAPACGVDVSISGESKISPKTGPCKRLMAYANAVFGDNRWYNPRQAAVSGWFCLRFSESQCCLGRQELGVIDDNVSPQAKWPGLTRS
jgi:hypothetical protein|tara:strand:+ start:369 stop:647 length:279 start_codon:yes stop_codon:yes gene_type:complete